MRRRGCCNSCAREDERTDRFSRGHGTAQPGKEKAFLPDGSSILSKAFQRDRRCRCRRGGIRTASPVGWQASTRKRGVDGITGYPVDLCVGKANAQIRKGHRSMPSPGYKGICALGVGFPNPASTELLSACHPDARRSEGSRAPPPRQMSDPSGWARDSSRCTPSE